MKAKYSFETVGTFIQQQAAHPKIPRSSTSDESHNEK
jgi:hypothetical protein